MVTWENWADSFPYFRQLFVFRIIVQLPIPESNLQAFLRRSIRLSRARFHTHFIGISEKVFRFVVELVDGRQIVCFV